MKSQEFDMQQEQTAEAPRKKKKKKGKAGLVLFIVVLVLAVGCGVGYYFLERQKPAKAVENFLTSVQKMDFASMESMLQSNDLSALDNADIRNDAYSEFFRNVNAKMTFSIRRNDFDIQNGTARITARIRYLDGSDIYKETVSEFLRQIVSTAFSGESLTEEDTQAKLASILSEKAAALEDKFSETDIVYPVIKTNDQWKIVALDDETVKLMSANFKSVEDEISQSLAAAETESQTGDGASQAPEAAEGDTIDMTSDKFAIRYTRHVVANDFAGSPCLLVYYDYTNNSSSASSAMVDVSLQAYQNGSSLNAAIPETNDSAIDQFMSEIEPGQTVNVCQAFSLQDMSNVTLQAGEAFSFGGGQTKSQTLTLQ